MAESAFTALRSSVKHGLNALLNPLNVQVDSLTEERAEAHRLERLANENHFSEPVFPVPASFQEMGWKDVVSLVQKYEDDISRLESPETNDVDFTFENVWYTSPDAEVLYALVREVEPERIVEVGSGNSTRLFEQAVIDGDFETTLMSIDPNPRTEIADHSDVVHRKRVERLETSAPFEALTENDILFIDSSHSIRTGNDVVFLFLKVLPKLSKGVLVHIHDIFLPYDYPAEWKVKEGWEWNEQYLVQSILQYGNAFSVLWAGHYVQRLLTDEEEFNRYFPRTRKPARSLWLRKNAVGQSEETDQGDE